MRISTNQIQLSMLDNLQRGFGDYARLDRQISSNKRILQPSDDPVGSVQLLGLKKMCIRDRSGSSVGSRGWSCCWTSGPWRPVSVRSQVSSGSSTNSPHWVIVPGRERKGSVGEVLLPAIG